MYDAWGERPIVAHIRMILEINGGVKDWWTSVLTIWMKLVLPNKTQWLVAEGSSADVGEYKLWTYRILNGSNIDWEVDKCVDLLIDADCLSTSIWQTYF